jgi:CubicO group peptidase (beta-lactamase class C family)
MNYSAMSYFSRRTAWMFCLVFVPFFGESQNKDIAALEQYIEQARTDWDVPGLAVAIVQDDRILLAEGFGVREIGSDDAVDAQTLFAMASTTKATVAAAMGTLVDAGLVDWDDPVVEHLPEFRLSVPYLTQTVRIRDLFTHNIGLGNADYLWVHGEFKEKDILERIAMAPMAYPYRGGYTYQNIMYLVAGLVIERISGMEWADFMEQRLYEPIGLKRTYPTRKRVMEASNRTRPHHYVNGDILAIVDMIADPIAPAGASWSCAEDMARWMLFMLDTARVDGQQILQPETWAELFKPQALIPKDQFYPTVQLTKPTWTSYGLGWFQHDYRGEAVQFHTGSLNGTVAICGLLPARKLGIYVFGNLDHAEVRHAIMYRVFDVLGFGDQPRDWSAEVKDLYSGFSVEQEREAADWRAKRKRDTKPTLSLAEYTGTYSHEMWGTIEITLNTEGDQLVARLGRTSYADLTHWHHDVFRGDYRMAGFGDDYIRFLVDREGKVEAIDLNGPQYTFYKIK